ncbi:DUF3413 domain-containing protein [Escherichia coli]
MVTHRQRYREKVSQMVSWGHWFALFNILLSLVIGSRYLFIADLADNACWSHLFLRKHYRPFQLPAFATYWPILFPPTFIVGSQRLMTFVRHSGQWWE